jgi:ketosteroid isomerase-like protein
MASSNLEIVRSIYADWERGDFFKRADWAHPEIERVWVGGPEPGSRKGLADVAAEQREFLSAWQDFRVVADDYRELDGQRVLVLVRYSGRGTTSGVAQEMEGAHLFHVRERVVTKLVIYLERNRALADLGLAREAGATD